MQSGVGKAVRGVLLLATLTVVGCGGGPPQPNVDKDTYEKVWAKFLLVTKGKRSDTKALAKLLEESKISLKDWDFASQTYGLPPAVAKALSGDTASQMKGPKVPRADFPASAAPK